jgi:hypothetical protein
MLLMPPLVRAPGKFRFDPAHRLNEIDRIIAVLLKSGGDGEHVGVENDVVRWKSSADQQFVGTRANLDAAREIVGLALARRTPSRSTPRRNA